MLLTPRAVLYGNAVPEAEVRLLHLSTAIPYYFEAVLSRPLIVLTIHAVLYGNVVPAASF